MENDFELEKEKTEKLIKNIQQKYNEKNKGVVKSPEVDVSTQNLTEWDKQRIKNAKFVKFLQHKYEDPSSNEPIKLDQLPLKKEETKIASLTPEAMKKVREVISNHRNSAALEKVIITPFSWGGHNPSLLTKKADIVQKIPNKKVIVTPVNGIDLDIPLRAVEKVSQDLPLDKEIGTLQEIPSQADIEFVKEKKPEVIDDLPEKPKSVNISNAMDLAILLSNKYDKEWLFWEPETLEFVIKEKLGIDIRSLDAILSIALCKLSLAPWKTWHIFEKVVLALNDEIPLFDRQQAISPAQIALAVYYIRRLRPDEVFSDEIQTFIAAICHRKGLMYLTPPLEFAQDELNRMHNNEKEAMELSDYWASVKDENFQTFSFKENNLGIQLSRLAAIKEYLKERGVNE